MKYSDFSLITTLLYISYRIALINQMSVGFQFIYKNHFFEASL